MVLKVFGVLQLVLIQIISGHISTRDVARQNVLSYVANTPLVEYGRSRRQINNPPVGLPENENLPENSLSNGLPLRNGISFSKYLRSNGLTNNFSFNNGFPNNSPVPSLNFPFSNMNIMPQNRLLPNINGLHNNGFPFNRNPNGLPGFSNIPNGLPSLNNIPNGLPNFDTDINGLPSLNNFPNVFPGYSYVPNGLNNLLNGFSGFNSMPNGLPGANNVPNIMPELNIVPNGLPGLNNVANGLPGLNNVPNGLPNNKYQKFINLPTGNNIMNLNNLPAANSLPNINNIPNLGSPSIDHLPCGNALQHLPNGNGLHQNNLPEGKMLPPINNILPFLDNFRITGFTFAKRVADINRYPRDNKPDGNQFQNGNGSPLRIPDGFPNIENYQSYNGFSDMTNIPLAPAALPTSVNRFLISNGVASEATNMPVNNGCSDISNSPKYNVMPGNEQRFVNYVPRNNDFSAMNNLPANTLMQNSNSRLMNAINDGMPLSNGGNLNEISANNGMVVNMPEIYVKNNDDNEVTSNNFQSVNAEMPVNNWNFEFVPVNTPNIQNFMPEGVQMSSNIPNDQQPAFLSNNLSLAQELANNLKIEGLANMPFLNGLPVAGITETVTVLNPY